MIGTADPKSTRHGGSRLQAARATHRRRAVVLPAAEVPFKCSYRFLRWGSNGTTVQRRLALLRDAPVSPSSRTMKVTVVGSRSANRVRFRRDRNLRDLTNMSAGRAVCSAAIAVRRDNNPSRVLLLYLDRLSPPMFRAPGPSCYRARSSTWDNISSSAVRWSAITASSA
jgi:hypothetical protein